MLVTGIPDMSDIRRYHMYVYVYVYLNSEFCILCSLVFHNSVISSYSSGILYWWRA